MTKVCSKCGVEKDISEFYKFIHSSDGYKSECKSCTKQYMAAPHYRTRKAQRRKEKIAEGKPVLEKEREQRRTYISNPENKQKHNEYMAGYGAERAKEDVGFYLSTRLRSRLGIAIKKGYKAGSAVRDLGCSIAELKAHLESKFQPGMTWENRGRGKGKWGIDHIIPLTAFDLANRQHVVLACNYLNLQPMWCEDNTKKGNKF